MIGQTGFEFESSSLPRDDDVPFWDRRNENTSESTGAEAVLLNGNSSRVPSIEEHIPEFDGRRDLTTTALRVRLIEARDAWLSRSPSEKTRENYDRDLKQFLVFVRICEAVLTERREYVAVTRLQNQGWQ